MSEEKGKYEYMRGNTHAQKYEEKVDDKLNIRCYSGDKETWEAAAKEQGATSLSEWVILQLNSAAFGERVTAQLNKQEKA